MVTGEKTVEFLKKTRYWDQRLAHEDGSFREFDYVDFQLGYRKPLRRFRVPWVGMTIVTEHNQEWGNGARVALKGEDFYAISLGPVCSTNSSAGNACLATPNKKTRMEGLDSPTKGPKPGREVVTTLRWNQRGCRRGVQSRSTKGKHRGSALVARGVGLMHVW